jgi:hypothetical protein
MLKGGCLCGGVRYEIGAAPLGPSTLCHCRSCQRASGAHAVAWITVPARSLHYLQSPPASVPSSPGVKREFCSRCGSPLTYWNESRGGEIDVTLCSLDDPNAMPPADHIWTEDAVKWESGVSALPRWERLRGR